MNVITDPSIETWANAMAGLIVFKYYIDMRFTPTKNALWEDNNLKEAKRFFRGQMYAKTFGFLITSNVNVFV